MKHKIQFREWLGTPPEEKYGFSEKPKINFHPEYDDEPMETIKISKILDELAALGSINSKPPNRLFENVMDYGELTNKMQVVVSPYGSLKIILRKNTTTLEGVLTPACHYIIPLINDYNHPSDGTNILEIKYAHKINELLQKMDQRGMLAAKKSYEGLKNLVLEMAQQVRQNHPKIMRFREVTESDKNNYTISFDYAGSGVEAPSANRAEQFDIHLNYDSTTGLVRCWGNEILSPTKQHLWYVQPSEWDEYFSPYQKNSEIISSISAALSTY